MGTATYSLSITAVETNHLAWSELAGCTRFFATYTFTTGC